MNETVGNIGTDCINDKAVYGYEKGMEFALQDVKLLITILAGFYLANILIENLYRNNGVFKVSAGKKTFSLDIGYPKFWDSLYQILFICRYAVVSMLLYLSLFSNKLYEITGVPQ